MNSKPHTLAAPSLALGPTAAKQEKTMATKTAWLAMWWAPGAQHSGIHRTASGRQWGYWAFRRSVGRYREGCSRAFGVAWIPFGPCEESNWSRKF